MDRIMIKKLIGVSAFLLISSAASAGLVSYDFTGGPTTFGDPLLFSQDGLDLSVTGTPGVSVDTRWGLGVKSSKRDSYQVDGQGPDETLSFSFLQDVDLVSVIFGNVQYKDDFSLSVDGTLIGSADIPGGNTFDFSAYNFTGNTFDFGVEGRNDDYFIRGITVDTVDVSEAGSLALLGLGLVGLGFSRRKSKA
jgi:hypothetical protein